MPEFLLYNTIDEFIDANENYILSDVVAHFSLIKAIQSYSNEGFELINAYNIIDEDKSFVLCVVFEGYLLIYSKKWDNSIIKELSKKITFDGVSFAGQRQIILDLFKYNEVEYNVFKDRIAYECNRVTAKIKLSSGQFGLAELNDLEKITELTYNYHLEEYKEHAFRDYENIRSGAKNNIENQIVFKWQNNNEVISIAMIVSYDYNLPIIGSFYTDKAKRGNGYGTSLLYSLTNYLLTGYEKCGLVSDSKDKIANKIFKEIGYEKIYEIITAHKQNQFTTPS